MDFSFIVLIYAIDIQKIILYYVAITKFFFQNLNSLKIEGPLSCLPEVRSTVRLITEWFTKTENNSTISAAIFSDG